MMIAPCKGCEDRVVGCHATCDRYKAYHEKNMERIKAKEKQRVINSNLLSPTVRAKWKYWREKGK